jgi:hypothetical protein
MRNYTAFEKAEYRRSYKRQACNDVQEKKICEAACRYKHSTANKQTWCLLKAFSFTYEANLGTKMGTKSTACCLSCLTFLDVPEDGLMSQNIFDSSTLCAGQIYSLHQLT